MVVKVGKPTERSKPGNRGKRDSQILVMHYLNRVHFDAPMSPLELEIYHQMRNVIGIAVDEQHLQRPPALPNEQPMHTEPVEFCIIKRSAIALYSLRERLFYQKVR